MDRNIEQQDMDKEPGAVIDFEASITASRLKHAVAVLRRRDDEAIFEISNGMLVSRVPDPANAALTQVSISMRAFNYCIGSESYRVGIDLNKMASILEGAEAEDDISIEAGSDGAWCVWKFKWSIHQRSLSLLDPEELRKCPSLELSHIVTMHLSGKEFKEIIAEAEKVGEFLEFQASADGVTFNNWNTDMPMEKYIGTLPTGSVELLSDDKARGIYRLDYLHELVADIIPADKIAVQFANNTPCEIRYERDGVSVQHILAPRFESR